MVWKPGKVLCCIFLLAILGADLALNLAKYKRRLFLLIHWTPPTDAWLRLQWNLRSRPPLLSDQFSKIPKVTKSNHYVWNILWATTLSKLARLRVACVTVGSITSRCSGNGLASRSCPEGTSRGGWTRHERATEIEPGITADDVFPGRGGCDTG